jgi:hypothetical protein
MTRPQAERMEHRDSTEFALTATPPLDTRVDDHGHAVRHGCLPHHLGAGPGVAQGG